MPVPKYLKQRNGFWYVQMRVPAKLRPKLGATLIRSLKTTDEAEANRKRHAVISKFQERIVEAGRAPDTNTTLQRLESLLQRACALFEAEGSSPHTTPLSLSRGDVMQARVDFDAEVDLVISSYPVDRHGEPDVPDADIAVIRQINAAAEGQTGRMLGALAECWLISESERRAMKAATLVEKRSHLRRFLEFVGTSTTPDELTQTLARRYVEEALNPLRVDLKRKSFMLRTAMQFCQWLRVRGMLKGDPFLEMSTLLRADKVERVERRAWRPEELKVFVESLPPMGDIWVLTVLMAYTGARPQELCMIQTQHVTGESLTIPASKTRAGRRTIPIHPVIRPLVAHLLQTTPDGYLISGQKPTGEDGNRYILLGKRAQTARNRVSSDPSIPLYALRHTVVTQMSEAGHPEWLCELIVGHEAGSIIGKHYRKPEGLQKMLEALQSVTYGEELDVKISLLG